MRSFPYLTLLCGAVAVLGSGCTEFVGCKEGDPPPQCCAGGCGSSTSSWLPAKCINEQWICEKGTIEDACASKQNACKALTFCGGNGPLGHSEADPAPELCCELSCRGTKVAHRVCPDGTLYKCPAGYLPVSNCPDYLSACGGIIPIYRANGYKLP